MTDSKIPLKTRSETASSAPTLTSNETQNETLIHPQVAPPTPSTSLDLTDKPNNDVPINKASDVAADPSVLNVTTATPISSVPHVSQTLPTPKYVIANQVSDEIYDTPAEIQARRQQVNEVIYRDRLNIQTASNSYYTWQELVPVGQVVVSQPIQIINEIPSFYTYVSLNQETGEYNVAGLEAPYTNAFNNTTLSALCSSSSGLLKYVTPCVELQINFDYILKSLSSGSNAIKIINGLPFASSFFVERTISDKPIAGSTNFSVNKTMNLVSGLILFMFGAAEAFNKLIFDKSGSDALEQSIAWDVAFPNISIPTRYLVFPIAPSIGLSFLNFNSSPTWLKNQINEGFEDYGPITLGRVEVLKTLSTGSEAVIKHRVNIDSVASYLLGTAFTRATEQVFNFNKYNQILRCYIVKGGSILGEEGTNNTLVPFIPVNPQHELANLLFMLAQSDDLKEFIINTYTTFIQATNIITPNINRNLTFVDAKTSNAGPYIQKIRSLMGSATDQDVYNTIGRTLAPRLAYWMTSDLEGYASNFLEACLELMSELIFIALFPLITKDLIPQLSTRFTRFFLKFFPEQIRAMWQQFGSNYMHATHNTDGGRSVMVYSNVDFRMGISTPLYFSSVVLPDNTMPTISTLRNLIYEFTPLRSQMPRYADDLAVDAEFPRLRTNNSNGGAYLLFPYHTDPDEASPLIGRLQQIHLFIRDLLESRRGLPRSELNALNTILNGLFMDYEYILPTLSRELSVMGLVALNFKTNILQTFDGVFSTPPDQPFGIIDDWGRAVYSRARPILDPMIKLNQTNQINVRGIGLRLLLQFSGIRVSSMDATDPSIQDHKIIQLPPDQLCKVNQQVFSMCSEQTKPMALFSAVMQRIVEDPNNIFNGIIADLNRLMGIAKGEYGNLLNSLYDIVRQTSTPYVNAVNPLKLAMAGGHGTKIPYPMFLPTFGIIKEDGSMLPDGPGLPDYKFLNQNIAVTDPSTIERAMYVLDIITNPTSPTVRIGQGLILSRHSDLYPKFSDTYPNIPGTVTIQYSPNLGVVVPSAGGISIHAMELGGVAYVDPAAISPHYMIEIPANTYDINQYLLDFILSAVELGTVSLHLTEIRYTYDLKVVHTYEPESVYNFRELINYSVLSIYSLNFYHFIGRIIQQTQFASIRTYVRYLFPRRNLNTRGILLGGAYAGYSADEQPDTSFSFRSEVFSKTSLGDGGIPVDVDRELNPMGPTSKQSIANSGEVIFFSKHMPLAPSVNIGYIYPEFLTLQ